MSWWFSSTKLSNLVNPVRVLVVPVTLFNQPARNLTLLHTVFTSRWLQLILALVFQPCESPESSAPIDHKLPSAIDHRRDKHHYGLTHACNLTSDVVSLLKEYKKILVTSWLPRDYHFPRGKFVQRTKNGDVKYHPLWLFQRPRKTLSTFYLSHLHDHIKGR